MDVDGEVRWLFPVKNGQSSTFLKHGFMNSEVHISLDGRLTKHTITSNMPSLVFKYLHHGMHRGKNGVFIYPTVVDSGTIKEMSYIAEIDESGATIQPWDLGQLLTDYMSAAGDEPSLLVNNDVDWFHVNDALYDPIDDTILVSSRQNFIMKIDYETGEIVWLLGDKSKYC